VSDEFPVLDELERRLVACCYGDGRPARAVGRWSRVRWRSGWAAVSISGTALAGAIAVGLLLASGGVVPLAARALADAARASQARSAPALAPGQYWYTRTFSSSIAPIALPPRVIAPGTNPAPTLVAVRLRQSLETWIGRDGTIRQRQSTLSERFADSAARRRWLASGEPLPRFASTDSVSEGDGRFPPQYSGAGDIGDGLFSYQQLVGLPTSVPGLRSRLEQAQAALARREQHGLATKVQSGTGYASIQLIEHGSVRSAKTMQDLTTIATLLSTPVPATVRAALYRVAASLPTVTYDGKTTDTLGRPGVAISVGTSAHGMRMIFNPATGALLQTSVVVTSSLHGIKLGTMTQTIAAQGIAQSLDSLPRGIRPIGHMRPSPQTIAITPRTGTPTTTFHIAVHSTHTSRSAAAAPLIAAIDGPTAQGCRAYLLPSPIAQLTRGVAIHASAHTVYRYDLPSTAIGRTAWCPGRYQLQILVNNQSSIYFEVR
jgi:hypothetical protein